MLRRMSLNRCDFPLAYRRREPTQDQSCPGPFRTHTVCFPTIRRSTATFAPGARPSSLQRAAGRVAWRLAVMVTRCMPQSVARIALLGNVPGKALCLVPLSELVGEPRASVAVAGSWCRPASCPSAPAAGHRVSSRPGGQALSRAAPSVEAEERRVVAMGGGRRWATEGMRHAHGSAGEGRYGAKGRIDCSSRVPSSAAAP